MPKKKPVDKIGYILVRVPEEIHKKFRYFCIEREMSMQKVIMEHIKDLIAD